MRYLLIILLILISGCKTKPKEHLMPHSEAEQIIMNFKLTETVKGITNFKLSASKAFVYENQTNVFNFILDFYKNGVPYATLKADSGILFTTNNDMDATGNVRVTGVEGATLETSYLQWSSTKELIYTDSTVLITTKDKKITGRKFESNPDLTNIKLKEPSGTGEAANIEPANINKSSQEKTDTTHIVKEKKEIKAEITDSTGNIPKPKELKLKGVK